MASAGCSAFSSNQQYWAFCGNDGKLKIWETATSRLKQEFVPNLHLSSPCSVIGWITVGQQSTSVAQSPWRKRKRKSISEDTEQKEIIAMGSVNGSLTLYDVSSASVNKVLDNGHSACITALTWSPSHGLFTAGDDHQIVEWNVQENGIKCKWKSGRSKITALALPSDERTIISADKIIKLWDLESKQVVGTFTGHANQVSFLKTIKTDEHMSYLISGAQGDSYLGVWSLNEKKERTSIASLTMQDDPIALSVQSSENSQMTVLAVNRSGQANLFTYQPNGQCTKPLKPTVTVVIAADSNQKESVQQVPIQSAQLTTNGKMLLVYGSLINLTFEQLLPDFSSKIMGLVRSDGRKMKEKKEEALTKVKIAETNENVEYLVPGAASAPAKRTRAGSQLPLKDRLENLSLNSEMNTSGKTQSKGANMAQLLLQGLNSKDKNILMNVLYNRDETIIKNTISKIPVQAISPLLKELTSMLQGKTYPSKIAVVWLKNLVITHAAHLLSHPDIGDVLSPILGLIDAKLAIFSELSRLRGRVALVTGQISHLNDQESKNIFEEGLLVYQDSDSSDEDTDVGEMEGESESDDNWAETSEQEEEQEDLENGKSDDDASICS
ncbi:WD repeat-containing protein 43 isoform X2 [Diachasma alloeum]|uniref:WD repeat-containing protein 43 isoform X2 n=1 Tax=Diachasma alloeum TaxID=454923 RepID=UPI0007382513|nr:WD repeat-containing protein 43 isoform X2 [Diachasma alloeum]